MSIKAMVYVWQTPYKSPQKLMLLAIADRCDDEGICFPGVSTLAKKCSIGDRGAQKMIAQLETMGEIVVVFNKGLETSHGNTNLYYMKAYRDTLGLKTPTSSKRKKRNGVSSGTSQEVNCRTSQEVSSGTPNTSVDSSEYSKDSTASIEAREITGSSSVKEESDGTTLKEQTPAEEAHPRPRSPKQMEQTAAAEALAAARGVTLVSTDYGLYIKQAAILVKAGVTAAEFALYVRRVRAKAKEEGWTETVSSLTAGGRVSEYVTARDAYRAKQEAGEVKGLWTGDSTTTIPAHREAVIIPETDVSDAVRAAFMEDSHV